VSNELLQPIPEDGLFHLLFSFSTVIPPGIAIQAGVPSKTPPPATMVSLTFGALFSGMVKMFVHHCMGTVKSWPEPLMEHLGKGHGQPWEYR